MVIIFAKQRQLCILLRNVIKHFLLMTAEIAQLLMFGNVILNLQRHFRYFTVKQHNESNAED